MTLTVFTPAYNRGYIIENLYRSLQRQTFRDFEWIVIDDGSTDNTEELFSVWTKENNFFKITYEKVQNGGKHRAINKGVKKAQGELFFIVDSDDYLTDNALERIVEVESSIPKEQKDKFGGVCGRKGYSEERDVGKTFEGEYLDITTLERPKYGITGDKSEVFYTDIMRKFPFPEFEGEKFVTECVVWDKIAFAGYKLRFFNDIIYICDYLPDGLTAQGSNKFLNNPKAWGLYLTQNVEFGKISGINKWNQFLNYYYALKITHKFSEIAANLHMNPVILWSRLFVMRVFYKLYSK